MVNQKIKAIIKSIKANRQLLKDSLVKDIIESSTNYSVIEYDIKYKPLLLEVKMIGQLIIATHSKNSITRQIIQTFKGKKINAFRNNEVGDYCEILIKDVFIKNKNKFKIIQDVDLLGGKGYPDLKIKSSLGNIFLEIKATSRPDKGSARDFYYSPGAASDRKIDCDALHILLGFVTEQIQTGFIIKDFKLVDVSKIKVSLKPEFNTDNLGIYCKEALINL